MTFRASVLIATLAVSPVFHAALAQDETLGRLFYTAKERASLDANVRSSSAQAKKPIPIPPSMTLNGVVTRSDGEQTVWIDGRAYHRTESGGLQVTTRSNDPGVVEIKVPGVPNRRSVRVGQRLDPATGEIFESYEEPHGTAYKTRPNDDDKNGSESASPTSEPQ